MKELSPSTETKKNHKTKRTASIRNLYRIKIPPTFFFLCNDYSQGKSLDRLVYHWPINSVCSSRYVSRRRTVPLRRRQRRIRALCRNHEWFPRPIQLSMELRCLTKFEFRSYLYSNYQIGYLTRLVRIQGYTRRLPTKFAPSGVWSRNGIRSTIVADVGEHVTLGYAPHKDRSEFLSPEALARVPRLSVGGCVAPWLWSFNSSD